ncbi:MAG: hypothetical protein RBS43_00615 [Candidatus Cloacimonas sp.]|jgi:hypothetical protein|nr:hypothetical protein [Candidatus Cloacimonas sp.]
MPKLLLSLVMIACLLPLAAQIDLPHPYYNPFHQSSGSLLSMDKLSMSHSMGFEAGSSSVGDGYYLSRYTNHLKYKFNPKLELNLDLNFVNFGSMNTSSKFELNNDNANTVIPEFSLSYKPNDSTLIQVQMFHNSLGNYRNNYNYGSNW